MFKPIPQDELGRINGVSRACAPSDLTQVIRLVRVAEEAAQDATAGAAEEQGYRIEVQILVGCSQDEYIDTQTENNAQPTGKRNGRTFCSQQSESVISVGALTRR